MEKIFTPSKVRLTAISLMMGGALFVSSANAALITWKAAVANGDWASASNWEGDVLPTAADDVAIPAGTLVTVSTTVGTINSLAVSGKVVIAATGELTINQTTKGTLTNVLGLVGGELENNGSLQLKNNLAGNTNSVLQFVDNATQSKFINNGSLLLDNLGSGVSGTSGSMINTKVIGTNPMAYLKWGGAVTVSNVTANQFLVVEGKLEMDGTLAIGDATTQPNFRFLKLQSNSELVISSTANIAVTTGFANSSNGILNLQASGNASFTNNGVFSIIGGSNTTGYGLYLNPQAGTPNNTVVNNGTLNILGHFPNGAIKIGGTSNDNTAITNAGTMTVTNDVDGSISVMQSAALKVLLTNNGAMRFSSTEAAGINGTAVTFGGNPIVYGYVATAVKPVLAFDGSVYTAGKQIVVELHASTQAQLNVVDLTGKIVDFQLVHEGVNTISVPAKGIYIVRLVVNGQVSTHKVWVK